MIEAPNEVPVSLSSIDTLAINAALADKAVKAARANVGPGVYPVDLVVHVAGTLAIGEDTTRTATASIPLLAALAYAIDAAGAVGPAVEKAILAGVARALRDGEDGVEGLACRPGIERAIADLKAAIATTLPTVPVKGAVRAALAVTVLESASAGLAVAAK